MSLHSWVPVTLENCQSIYQYIVRNENCSYISFTHFKINHITLYNLSTNVHSFIRNHYDTTINTYIIVVLIHHIKPGRLYSKCPETITYLNTEIVCPTRQYNDALQNFIYPEVPKCINMIKTYNSKF